MRFEQEHKPPIPGRKILGIISSEDENRIDPDLSRILENDHSIKQKNIEKGEKRHASPRETYPRSVDIPQEKHFSPVS